MIRLIFTAFVLGSVSVSADGPPVSCCLKLRQTRPRFDKILSYRIQTKEMCPIRAVLIQTVLGRTLCSDPENSWTKEAMRKVDEEQKKAGEKDPVPTEGASVEGSRGREDPTTTIQKNKQKKSKTKSQKRTKKKKSQKAVKSKKRKCKNGN